MKIENQVCTLEQAKKIVEFFKDAGVEPPESYFMWGKGRFTGDWYIVSAVQAKERGFTEKYRAWSCAEAEFLIDQVRDSSSLRIDITRCINKNFTYYTLLCGCENWGLGNFRYGAHWRTEVIIRFLEKGIIKPGDLKF